MLSLSSKAKGALPHFSCLHPCSSSPTHSVLPPPVFGGIPLARSLFCLAQRLRKDPQGRSNQPRAAETSLGQREKHSEPLWSSDTARGQGRDFSLAPSSVFLPKRICNERGWMRCLPSPRPGLQGQSLFTCVPLALGSPRYAPAWLGVGKKKTQRIAELTPKAKLKPQTETRARVTTARLRSCPRFVPPSRLGFSGRLAAGGARALSGCLVSNFRSKHSTTS